MAIERHEESSFSHATFPQWSSIMPFLGVLLMVAAGAAVWWWRMKNLREAGSEIIDSVERMRGAYKRRQFRNKAEASLLASIQNPAIAAAVFFLALAREKP